MQLFACKLTTDDILMLSIASLITVIKSCTVVMPTLANNFNQSHHILSYHITSPSYLSSPSSCSIEQYYCGTTSITTISPSICCTKDGSCSQKTVLSENGKQFLVAFTGGGSKIKKQQGRNRHSYYFDGT